MMIQIVSKNTLYLFILTTGGRHLLMKHISGSEN